MNLFKKIWRQFRGHQRNRFPDAQHVINEAFTCNGLTYYCFDNTFNLPYQRGLAAITVYEELRMKCDYDLLKSFTTSIDKILSGTKIGLPQFYDVKRMNDIIRERLNWVVDTDLVYKLAAVVFFDSSESPYKYDPKYAADKIERWKNDESINDFFLREPIQTLIPFLKGSELNFQEFSEAQKQLSKSHREIISSKLLANDGKNSSDKPSPLSATVTPRKQD